MSEGLVIAMGAGLLGIISWFLRMIYKSFEETKNDVKSLLINGGKRDEEIDNIHENVDSIKADVHTIILNHNHFEKRLTKVEDSIEIIKVKKL